jgi:PIN domain nuclease of toxin-antitoxin system
MSILLDTHIFLWFIQGDSRLKGALRKEIENRKNTVIFSAASCWEICIKISIGKLQLAEDWQRKVDSKLAENNIIWLEIKKDHMAQIVDLPWHHRDPFDRLLIAQALTEDFLLCSQDPSFSSYGVNLLS